MTLDQLNTQWGDIFDSVGQRYGLDPDILRAISLQENVNPKYNNPLGRSSNAGVYHYSADQGKTAIGQQARLLTDPNGPYADFVRTGSIHDLAKVYSPVGAKNDVYGTNADEPHGIAAMLAQIKGQSDPIYNVSVPSGGNVPQGTSASASAPLATPATTVPDAQTQALQAQLAAAMASTSQAPTQGPSAATPAQGPAQNPMSLLSYGMSPQILNAILQAKKQQQAQVIQSALSSGGSLANAVNQFRTQNALQNQVPGWSATQLDPFAPGAALGYTT
jgi:hypothetical protein